MKKFVKAILPQGVINNFYHLPKAVLANMVYGSPARGLKVIGVTGTDGKTTTVNMIYQILKLAGKKVSMVSTINAPGLHVTSPGPFTIQKFIKQAKEKGDEYLVLEVTSHALDQYRFWGIKFHVGVITNVTWEHLDYHKTYSNYFFTKLKLLKNAEYKIVNAMLKPPVPNSITFGLERGDFNETRLKLKLKISGEYNIENALAALAVAYALNIDKNIAQKALDNFTGITGRMEEIKNNKGIKIIIDFAHTPNALERVLKTLRKPKGKLIAVFGSAGKRDTGKRGLMGEIAGKLADLIVITAEDPRGELSEINKQILAGVKKSGVKKTKVFIIDDRFEAIKFAIEKLAGRGDIVGIFGKGHEKSQNLDGKKEIPWSDFEAVKKILDGH